MFRVYLHSQETVMSGTEQVSGVCISPRDSILIIFADPLDEILRGKKRYEIRGKRCPSKLGTRVWLAAYGSSAITGSAYVAACHGPLDTNTWEALRSGHCVPGPRLYGDHTFAWEFHDVRRCASVPFRRKQGAITWQTGPG